MTIEVTFTRQHDEVINRKRCLIGKKFNCKGAFAGYDRGRYLFADARNRAAIIDFRVACLHRTDAIGKIADAIRFQECHGFPSNQMIG